MCLGLPLRTTNDTIELVTIPLVGPVLHDWRDGPGLHQLLHVGAKEKLTTSAGRPWATAVAWVPDGP